MTRSKILAHPLSLWAPFYYVACRLIAADTSPQPLLNHATAFGAGHVTLGEAPPPMGCIWLTRFTSYSRPTLRAWQIPLSSTRLCAERRIQPVYNVLGVGVGFPNYSVPDAPPDTTLAVGTTEVVEWVNTSYVDLDKSTGADYPFERPGQHRRQHHLADLLPGTLCANNNDGDIIVKFDRDAQRWIMAQNVFSEPYVVCVAVSQTATFSDNRWYAYQFPVVNSGFPDYPKWGVWSSGGASDGYFQNWNNFGPGGSGFVGPVMCGYDRGKMLVGDSTAEQICFQLDGTEDSLLPADRDSPVAPPATEDEFFIGSVGDVDNEHLSLYSMHITDWATGSATQ